MPVDLSAREWQLLGAMRARKTPLDVAAEWGTSRQNVDKIRRGLERKGVIVRRSDVPWWMKYSKDYPWIVRDGLDVRYEPAVPPDAEFRVLYPTDQTEGLVVPTIRVVRWDTGGWTVQGLPAGAWRDGRVAVMEHRVVWCRRAGDDRSWAFPAPVDRMWMEDHTVAEFERKPAKEYRLRLTPKQRVGLTQCIAAVVGVDPILELSVPAARE